MVAIDYFFGFYIDCFSALCHHVPLPAIAYLNEDFAIESSTHSLVSCHHDVVTIIFVFSIISL